MVRTSLLGALLLHAAGALHVSKLQRRHVLQGCGLAVASPLIARADDEPAVPAEAPVVEAPPPPPPAKTSAIDDARDRAKRYAGVLQDAPEDLRQEPAERGLRRDGFV